MNSDSKKCIHRQRHSHTDTDTHTHKGRIATYKVYKDIVVVLHVVVKAVAVQGDGVLAILEQDLQESVCVCVCVCVKLCEKR